MRMKVGGTFVADERIGFGVLKGLNLKVRNHAAV